MSEALQGGPVNEVYVLEFDYRSDGGPNRVGPFPSRTAAFEWADRFMAGEGREAIYHAAPITPPADAVRP